MTITPIAHFRSPLTEKFGIPRQAGLAPELPGRIVFEPEYSSPDALKGMEGFDFLWIIWAFDRNPQSATFQATVRPPRLGGNERMGVFATRSSFRPNGLALSSVRIAAIGEGWIDVLGADLADGTPIFDIKPYIEYADSHPGVRSGFVDGTSWKELEVDFGSAVPESFPEEKLQALKKVLSLDPRPSYQNDPERVYGMAFDGFDVHFCVDGERLSVKSISRK